MSASAPEPFPELGIRLSYVDEFIRRACKGKTLEGKTTTDVCEEIVKPLTKDCKKSFCEMMVDDKHPAVGKAVVFISHAWKYPFLDVISALKSHFKANPDIVIWFDLFSNNQHSTTEKNFEWWCGVFMNSIDKLQHVVMLLSPWGEPIALQRAWCLFEAFCSAKTKCKFEVAMSDPQKLKFFDAVMDDAHKHVNSMLARIDCEYSDCWFQEDKERIFEAVRRDVGGFGTINSMVFEQLRRWVIKVTLEEIDSVGPTRDKRRFLSLQNSLGDLFEGQTELKRAEECFKICVDVGKKELGPNDAATLLYEYKLADLWRLQGNFAESEPLHRQCLEKRKDVLHLPEDHEDVLRSMTGLANLLSSQKRFADAEPLYEKVYQLRKTKSGEMDIDTLTSMSNLGAFYHEKGDYERAELLYEECLKLRKDVLKVTYPDPKDPTNRSKDQVTYTHPDILLSQHNLAGLYLSIGNYEKAESQIKETLDGRRVRLGHEHKLTLSTLDNLAVLYREKGHINAKTQLEKQALYDKALPLHIECCEIAERVLGKDNPDTITYKASMEKTNRIKNEKK